jgi:hypothetical protein
MGSSNSKGVFMFGKVSERYSAVAAADITGKSSGMDTPSAIEQLRQECNQLASGITRMHPWIPKLGDAEVQGEIFRAVFELTKQVEVVKKQLLRLEKRDDSSLT